MLVLLIYYKCLVWVSCKLVSGIFLSFFQTLIHQYWSKVKFPLLDQNNTIALICTLTIKKLHMHTLLPYIDDDLSMQMLICHNILDMTACFVFTRKLWSHLESCILAAVPLYLHFSHLWHATNNWVMAVQHDEYSMFWGGS